MRAPCREGEGNDDSFARRGRMPALRHRTLIPWSECDRPAHIRRGGFVASSGGCRGLLDSGARDAEHGGVEGVAGGVARGAAVAVLLASLRALGHYSRGS